MSTKKDPDKVKKLGDSPALRTENMIPSNMTGSMSKNGTMEIRHEDHKNPKSAWVEKQGADGSWTTTEVSDGQRSHTNEHHVGDVRTYVAKGQHGHTDGNDASSGGENRHEDYKKDKGAVTGENEYSGVGKQKIGGSGQGSFDNNTGGNTYKTSDGDIVHLHTGHVHSHNDGDHVESVQGNKHVMIGGGEYGIHVQGGNMDTSVETGRLHLYSGGPMSANSPSPIHITSLTNIRLQVGASIIDITPAGITMVAPLISLTAAGAITASAGGLINVKAIGTAIIDSAATTIAGEAGVTLNSAGYVETVATDVSVTAATVNFIQG